jgi:Type III restriction enzyme, res subunit
MVYLQERKFPEVGSFNFEVFGTGRHGRHTASRFSIRCDALALTNNEMLLMSVAGPETSVKALSAGLRASGRDQRHVEYSAQVGEIAGSQLGRSQEGYRIYRTKLPYGLWHILCLAKRNGFLPALTDESLWQYLLTGQFTTPLLRDWMPWLRRRMREQGLLLELTQVGCDAGLLLIDSDTLDKLVSEGIKKGELSIGRQKHVARQPSSIPKDIHNLDQYMIAYGSILGQQAERSLDPLHIPGQHRLRDLDVLRDPFDAQAHVIEASRKALSRQKALVLVGEMGTGKTLMGMTAVHAHANGQPYRALVFCPGQLVNKWEREIRETIPAAAVVQVTSWKSLLRLDRTTKPRHITWYIIPRDRAKLGAKWRPAYLESKQDGFLRCPNCGLRLVTEDREPLYVGKPAKNGKAGTGLWKRRSKCEWVLKYDNEDRLFEGCGSPLWQMTGEVRRYEPALFIKRHLRHFFKYLILDEVHEEKGSDTAQGHAAGALAASCRKVIALTGTLVGGYAEHLRPLLFRLSPGSLVHEGLGWSNATAFNERYGRIETRITERSGGVGEDNRMSRGSKTTIKCVRPGVMPALFGRHLIDKAVFLSLNEVADNLPGLTEECVPVRMDTELARAYRHEVEGPLVEAIKEMMKRRDRRLLGAMLQTLLAYPDFPFGWKDIGYWQGGVDAKPRYVIVAKPPNLPDDVIRPKEQALIDLVAEEKARDRKVWVYVNFTDKHDVEGRLEKLLMQAGLQVGVLRSSVTLACREEWIAKHAPGLDVVISHPKLVETGLDLFDKNGRHNFPTICFYECGYNLFTLRQASRRSWRIGQREDCRVVYLYYESTMQDRALALMGKKLTAAQALEGSFSTEGLVAMAGEDANVELALARSLVERLDEGDARRAWSKVIPLPNRSIEESPVFLPFPKRQEAPAAYRPCAGMLF